MPSLRGNSSGRNTGIVKKKYWMEILVFASLLLIGFCLSLLQIIGIKIPNPGSGIGNLIKLFIKI
jgi:hypothetical protein